MDTNVNTSRLKSMFLTEILTRTAAEVLFLVRFYCKTHVFCNMTFKNT